MIEVRVKKLSKDAQLPFRATKNSMGADLRACLYDEEAGGKLTKIVVPAHGVVKIETKLAMQIPEGQGMLIAPRSSVGVKKNLALANTTGVIDADYRGQIILFMRNLSDEPVVIEDGERIAQAITLPDIQANYIEVEELEDTERGEGGFGSTNKF